MWGFLKDHVYQGCINNLAEIIRHVSPTGMWRAAVYNAVVRFQNVVDRQSVHIYITLVCR